MKYYTPEIEELHIGFEYEYNHASTEYPNWQKEIYEESSFLTVWADSEWEFTLDSMIKAKCLRVKYLDREDIEERRWRSTSEYGGDHATRTFEWFELRVSDKREGIWRLRFESDGRIMIEQGTHWMRFFGYLKNISELKKLMKQLGI